MTQSEGFRIVRLPPMSVAAAHASGESPESKAWALLCGWAEPQGLLKDPDLHPIFGFNNPNPELGRREYGYEFWIVVEDSMTDVGQLKLKRFDGGLFAVTDCKLIGDSRGSVPEIWRSLYESVQVSGAFCWRQDQELEKLVNPGAAEQEIMLELHLPVEETGTEG